MKPSGLGFFFAGRCFPCVPLKKKKLRYNCVEGFVIANSILLLLLNGSIQTSFFCDSALVVCMFLGICSFH